MNIKKANFRMIEAELYNYKETVKELGLLREEIIESSPSQDLGERIETDLGDGTANKAIKLCSSKELLEIQRRVSAIEKSKEVIKKEHKKYRLMEMKYFERRYTNIGIQMELDISERTFYRWRREIVELVALYLGCRV